MVKLKKFLVVALSFVAIICSVIGVGVFGVANAFAASGTELIMDKGAAVRVDNYCTGMRFSASMSKSAYESISENVSEAGMFIMPEDYVAKYGDLTEANLFGGSAVYSGVKENGKTRIINIKYDGMTYSEADAKYLIRGTISNIIEANYSRNFVARAYLKMKDGSVKLAAYYGDSVVNNTRSVQNVAKNALSDGTKTYSGRQLSVLSDYVDYSSDIVGERYLPIFEPQGGSGASNSIEWDQTEKAYKFSFVSAEGDERGFGINAEFFHKLASKTGATGLKFKLKAGSDDFTSVALGYIPNWWNQEGARSESVNSSSYTEILFDFVTLPTTENGSFKTPFVLAPANSGVSSCLYIKDVEVVKPYDMSVEIDADKLTVDNLSVNNSKLFYDVVTSGYPEGGRNAVLKSFTSTEEWKTVWNGNDMKFTNPISAEGISVVSLRVYVADSAKKTVNVVVYKTGETDPSVQAANVRIPTNRWYNVIVNAESLAENGQISGVQFAIPEETSVGCTAYLDAISVLKENSAEDYLVENGLSEYSVLIPENASATVITAKDELVNLFKEATGVTLPVVTSATDGNKYISLGETGLFSNGGYTAEKSELGTDGYKILTANKNIYVCGGSDKGTLYGVYGLLEKLFDFDAYYVDTYSINEVSTLALPQFGLTEIPDIAHRVTGNYGVTKDVTAKNRLRYEYYGENFILVGGEMSHNSLLYVQGNANETDDWYNKNGKWSWSKLLKTQLCYTARGNETAYNNMVAAAVDTLKNALIANPDKTVVTFSGQDNLDACKCSACQKSDSNGYNETDRVLTFVNTVYGKILEWFEGDGSAYKRDLDMVVYAYLTTASAPQKVRPVSGVKILYAPIGFDFTSDITASVNSSLYAEAEKWNEMTDEIYLWIYSANFYYYLAPYLNVDSMQSYYRFAKSAGARWIFDQSQHDNAFATGFSNLKSYLASKLARNVESDVSALTDKFFDAYFGTASGNMRAFYNEFNEAYKNASGLHKETSCQVKPEASYWSKDSLIGWLDDCSAALNAIESLKTTDNAAYTKYHKHIVGERLSVLYLLIELYRGEMTDEVKNAYIETFKSDVLETGISFPRESGAQSFDDLYSSWGTSPAEGVTTDLANPTAGLAVSGSVTSLTLRGKTVSADNYAVADGKLTINPAYLGELGEGNYVFKVTLSGGTLDWYVTVTDKEAPNYEVVKEEYYQAGEITLPVATNKSGSYQRLTPVYYLDGIQKDEGETVTLEEGEYTLTVKFMRNGTLIDGEIVATIVVIDDSYVLGTEIDMTSENVTAVDAGISGLWNKNAYLIAEGDPNYVAGGKGYEYFLTTDGIYNYAGGISLNKNIIVRDETNCIQVRMYVKASDIENAEIKFFRSDITDNATSVRLNGEKIVTVATNKWVYVDLPIEIFSVGGMFRGLKVGAAKDGQTAVTGVYIDDITITDGSYVIGTEIDMTEENVTVPAKAGLGGLWDMSAQFITEENGEYVAGGKGGEIRFSQNEINAAGMITLNSPITVKDGMNYIRVRMYVKTSSAETATIRWNKSNNGVHDVGNKDITIKANEWVNTYLEVSYFAVDGKVDGIKLGYVGQSISGIYVDDITIVTESYTLGDLIDMNGITLNGVDGFGLSSFWVREVLDSVEGITGYSGKVARFRNYNGSSYGDMWAHAANITLNNPVTVKDGMNYVRVRVYISYSTENVNLRFYRSDRTNHQVEKDVWSDYEVGVATNGWVNVYLPVSKFAVDGKINGFKFGCFTNTGDNAAIYIDNISITDIIG